MNDKLTMYKVLAGVFILLSIVLGVLLYQKNTDVIKDDLGDSISLVEECNTRLTEWRSTNGDDVEAASQEARADLEKIIQECSVSFE